MQISNRQSVQVWGWIVGFLLLTLFWMIGAGALIPKEGYALGGKDIHELFYPWYWHVQNALSQGRIPFWDPYQFGGYPFLSNPQVALFYPPSWLIFLLPIPIGISLFFTLHLWLAGSGMFLLVRDLSRTDFGAVLAAISFMFSGFMMTRIYAGHIGVIAVYTWLPWILIATAWAVKRATIPAAIIAGLPFGLAVLAGHSSSLIYIGLIWAWFTLYLMYTTKSIWLIARQVVIAGLIGIMLGAVQLLPLIQLLGLTARSVSGDADFARMFSMPFTQFVTLIIPMLGGHPMLIGFWSKVANFEEFNYYVGILPLLGLLVAFRKPRLLTWSYAVLIIIGLLMSTWTVYRRVESIIPIFSLERVPARAAVFYLFFMSAMWGEIIALGERFAKSSRTLRQGLTAVIPALVAGLSSSITLYIFARGEGQERSVQVAYAGWATALLIVVLGGVLLIQFIRMREGRQRNLVRGGLIFVTLLDLWLFGHLFVENLTQIPPDQPWVDAKAIIGETEHRIVPFDFVMMVNGAEQAGYGTIVGYNTLELNSTAALHKQAFQDITSSVYDIYSVKYFLTDKSLIPPENDDHQLTLVDYTSSVYVYEREPVLDIARLVYQYEVLPANVDAATRLTASDFDPATTVILNQQPDCASSEQVVLSGTAEIISHVPEQWVIRTESDVPAILVLSETAYPDWQVTIDGIPAESLTAYSAIRAVCVPAGIHEVVWSYRPTQFVIGGAISIAALALVLGSAASVLWRRSQNRLNDVQESEAE